MAINYFDYDIEGNTFIDGNAIVYENDEAIKNAISQWLVSKRGDYLKNPSEGGILDYFLFKNMTNSNLELIGFAIQNLFTINLVSLVKLVNISIQPDYTNRSIDIDVVYKINGTNTVVTEQLSMDKVIDKKSNTYLDIDYIEENLFEFVKIQKYSHPSQKLIYDNDVLSWVWGKYKFINLVDTDEYFERILYVCNVS
ncbi:MAG TPA: hypothetical protein PLU55_01655 [Candidatus Pacearchaeota archaeon]|nr:hypothetical protein [Candidatus Pacearchaeota archaeon]